VNLVDTNFLPTHLELVKTLSTEETSLSKFFDAVEARPNNSIFNRLLINFISHILYSSTGGEKPLINYLFAEQFDLVGKLCAALYVTESEEKGKENAMECHSKRSFYFGLANRLIRSANESAPQGAHIDSMIKASPNAETWTRLCKTMIRKYMNEHHPGNTFVNSTISTTRSSNAIEIDELRHLSFGAEPFDDFPLSQGARLILEEKYPSHSPTIGLEHPMPDGNVNENGIFAPPAHYDDERDEPQLNHHITAGGSPTLQLFALLEKIEQSTEVQSAAPPPDDNRIGGDEPMDQTANTAD